MQSSDLSPERLRELAETRPERGVALSLYVSLDPREFATPPARASAIRSLVDDAHRQIEEAALEHDEQQAARADLERARTWLEDELDPDGAHGVALFASGPAHLWETVRLARPVDSLAHVDTYLALEPLAEGADATRWGVLLASRNSARFLRGTRDALVEVGHRDDDVHGQHQQGGWSQARYQRSVDEDVAGHLSATMDDLVRAHRRRPFDALLIGGPEDFASRVEEALPAELAGTLAGRIVVDVDQATPDDVLAAAQDVFLAHERTDEEQALDRLRQGIGGEGDAAAGWDDVLGALNEQKVEILLLDAREGHGEGRVCPQCGWLGTDGDACPVDGTALGRRDDIAEAAIEAALKQSARVMRVRHDEDALAPHEGVAAVLRF